jgi:hypothetical protein
MQRQIADTRLVKHSDNFWEHRENGLCLFEFRKAKNTNLRAFAIIALKSLAAEGIFFGTVRSFSALNGQKERASWKGSLKPGAMSLTKCAANSSILLRLMLDDKTENHITKKRIVVSPSPHRRARNSSGHPHQCFPLWQPSVCCTYFVCVAQPVWQVLQPPIVRLSVRVSAGVAWVRDALGS